MKKIAVLIFLISPLLVFNSCDKVKGKGDVISQIRDVKGFTQISLSLEGDLYFVQDSAYKVEIQAQQNILDVIESAMEGDRLVFKIKEHTILGNHEPIRINVHAPSVDHLDVSGSGNITVGSLMDQQDIYYNIGGSGNIILSEVKCKSVNGTISGSGNITGSYGISDLELLTISGSGNMDFINLMVDSVYVNISGSGDVKVYAVKYLDVKISGSGNVLYDGNPVIKQYISGSGSVAHI